MTTGFCEIDGIRLEWRRIGHHNGPPLVLLHEGLGSVSMWRDFPDRLAADTRRTVFVYSRRGYGRSSRASQPPAINHRDESLLLFKVLDAAGIDTAVLVGHSDGATIALLAAAHDPARRIAGVVALAPHSFVEEVCLAAIREAVVAFGQGLRERLSRYHDDVDGAFGGWSNAWLAPTFRAWDIRADLAGIACPLLVIQGTADEYGTLAQVDEVLARVRGAQSLVLAGCGHSPHRDRPDAVVEAIRGFLPSTKEKSPPA
ncbi:MAG: alpha/beta fold hydrolase [Solirubrobacterales bacterium]